MKITIDIPNEEIKEAVVEKVSEVLAKEMLEQNYGDALFYRRTIKECIREVIKSDISELSDRAVEAAAKSIENRAVKKLWNQLQTDSIFAKEDE